MSVNECQCERELPAADKLTTKEKILKLYNDMLALTEEDEELTRAGVDTHFWHGDRRLLTLHQFCGFDEIVLTMRLLACEKGIPIGEITLSCEKGGDKGGISQ